MHFGKYLIHAGIATPEQVLAALDEQRRNSPFVGQIAIREGMLDIDQVLEILDRMHATQLPFGMQAMELGYLTEAGYDRLGELKRRGFEPLGEILLRQGILTRKRLIQALREFFSKHRGSESRSRTAGTFEESPAPDLERREAS